MFICQIDVQCPEICATKVYGIEIPSLVSTNIISYLQGGSVFDRTSYEDYKIFENQYVMQISSEIWTESTEHVRIH